jgi:hypothetical protein
MIYVRSSGCNLIPQSIHNLCTFEKLVGAALAHTHESNGPDLLPASNLRGRGRRFPN